MHVPQRIVAQLLREPWISGSCRYTAEEKQKVGKAEVQLSSTTSGMVLPFAGMLTVSPA